MIICAKDMIKNIQFLKEIKTTETVGQNQLQAGGSVDNQCVVERVADSHIVIITHYSNQKTVGTSQAHKKIELGSTPRKRNSWTCEKQIGQHFWYNDQGVAGFTAREDKEKEIHGGAQTPMQTNDSHDGGVAIRVVR